MTDLRALQTRLGVSADGDLGPITLAAMHRKLDELAALKATTAPQKPLGLRLPETPPRPADAIATGGTVPSGSYSLTWLGVVLRRAGCKTVELAGWHKRGRAEMGTVKGVLCHHTAGAKTGNSPSLNLVVNGRPDLPGPLSQLHLARDGTFTVIAAGRCNHAGAGEWQGVTTGNSSFIGIEAENAGTGSDPWPDVQTEAYARGVAAILKHIKAPVIMCAGHKEYALPRGRKIDPAFDMAAFRERVKGFMA